MRRQSRFMKTQARHSLNNKLLKYGVKGHLLTAGMCHLCKADVVSITNALEKYQDLDPTFSGTRECKFLADLASAIDEEDIAKFTDVSKEFDSVSPLVWAVNHMQLFGCKLCLVLDHDNNVVEGKSEVQGQGAGGGCKLYLIEGKCILDWNNVYTKRIYNYTNF
ncbi:Tetratricopeptide-like helical domain superfamily [Arabidopsis thaliana x Arabidopsis arenosa]|uniref:Tetratricopeptide-like helical domain superfamily n=1 Tax=Arabidopsis thaliana x Arabidopsis arenosa TaxID=1240361 RepID=A0A8T2F127_9BRAS|nr:Tetratricopeptide-like helical domain superfamily [Arabidopsis thaliana x Arabidopsis arenosa]